MDEGSTAPRYCTAALEGSWQKYGRSCYFLPLRAPPCFERVSVTARNISTACGDAPSARIISGIILNALSADLPVPQQPAQEE
jgi:hypothetical protein